MCYIAMTLSWGKWYLQTIHGFWFNLFRVWGLQQMTMPEISHFLYFLPWKIIFLYCFWLKAKSDIIWNALTENLYIFTYFLYKCSICSKLTDFFCHPIQVERWQKLPEVLTYDGVHVCLSLKCDKDFIFLFQKGEKRVKWNIWGWVFFSSALKFLSKNASGFYFPVWF